MSNCDLNYSSRPDYYKLTLQHTVSVIFREPQGGKSKTCYIIPISDRTSVGGQNFPGNMILETDTITDKSFRNTYESSLSELRENVWYKKGGSDAVYKVPFLCWPVLHDFLKKRFQCVNWTPEEVCEIYLQYEFKIEGKKSPIAAVKRTWTNFKNRILPTGSENKYRRIED